MQRAIATRTRAELLSDLQALAPLIVTLGHAAAVAEKCRAIDEVGRWWP